MASIAQFFIKPHVAGVSSLLMLVGLFFIAGEILEGHHILVALAALLSFGVLINLVTFMNRGE